MLCYSVACPRLWWTGWTDGVVIYLIDLVVMRRCVIYCPQPPPLPCPPPHCPFPTHPRPRTTFCIFWPALRAPTCATPPHPLPPPSPCLPPAPHLLPHLPPPTCLPVVCDVVVCVPYYYVVDVDSDRGICWFVWCAYLPATCLPCPPLPLEACLDIG